MNKFDFLTESAVDVISHIDDEIRPQIESILCDVAQKVELDQESLDIINFGNRVKPELYLTNYPVEIGTIKINDKGEAFLEADDLAREKIELAKDVRDSINNTEEKGETWLNEITSEDKEKTMELMGSKAETLMTRSQVAQETIDKINESLSSKGYKNPLVKQQQKLLSDMEKADKKEMKNFSAKNQYKSIISELNTLYDQLKKELETAKENGFSKDDSEKIQLLAEEIAKSSAQAAILQSDIPTLKDRIFKTLSDKSSEVKNSVTSGINKIKAGIETKIQAGRNALTSIKEEVTAANDRFHARTDTMYTGLTEKVEQVSRDWKAVTYTVDKSICNAMEQVKNTLEKSYDKQAEIKGAFKDLGRAFIGKERTGERTDYTENQKACLNFLTRNTNKLQNEMAQIKSTYDISLAASIHNIKSAQEHRGSTGLDFSKSLDENIKNAIARSQKMKDQKPVAREVPTKSNDDMVK